MRPVERGISPQTADFERYEDARPFLVSRLGSFCSYCERRIKTGLAVEHLQAKDGPYGRPDLIGSWTNFLLGCVNCNSSKGDRDVRFERLYFPDRDNTFVAIEYTPDGRVSVVGTLTPAQAAIGRQTLALTGLDRRYSPAYDANGNLVALDRVSQRMEVWGIAEVALRRRLENRSGALRETIVDLALAHGSFSIWMKVFEQDVEMRQCFIQQFPGTAPDCFDPVTILPVTPRPPNGLESAGKI